MALLLIFIQSLVLPTELLALTGGPHQPEYTSYEETVPKDMVNLITGDFTYGVPAVTVPGPEGGFSMPLSYHSGIGLDQEASWVGLGWSLNPGAIIRNVVEYPDDAKGQTQYVHRENQDLEHGWYMNVPAIGQFGYSSNTGHSGRVSILNLVGLSYENGSVTEGNLIGVNFSSSKVDADPVAVVSAVMTIASYGMAAAASSETSLTSVIAKDAAMQVGTGLVASAVFSGNAMNSPTDGYWQTSSSANGFLKKNYHVWLDQTRTENMYGILYLGDMPRTSTGINGAQWINAKLDDESRIWKRPLVFVDPEATDNTGAASDMYYNFSGKSYIETENPSSLAKDIYRVNGPGVSGLIEPYRTDIGSLAMPRQMTIEHMRIAAAPFNSGEVNRVQYRYKNSIGNRYYNQAGSVNPDPDNPELGMSRDIDPNVVGMFLDDPILYHDKTTTESNREGLLNGKLHQSNQVEWFTNEEIINGVEGLLDVFETNDPCISHRNSVNPGFVFVKDRGFEPGTENYDLDKNIGAFRITRADGQTFHYSAPIYNFANNTYIEDLNDPDNITEIYQEDPFASSWLLTSITGPDFLDRNNNGIPDENDWGYWVKFNYNKHTNTHFWRYPYDGFKNSSDNNTKSYQEGIRQSIYLTSIQTRSHRAVFFLDYRSDAKSQAPHESRGTQIGAKSSMKLDRVIILKNDDCEKMISPVEEGGLGFVNNYSGCDFNLNNIWRYPDLLANDTVQQFITENALSQVVFNYDYSLCKYIPNSSTPNSSIGKLTLKGVSMYGRNNFKIMPDYEFEYGSNPYYDRDKWDGWGFYNPDGNENGGSHKAYQFNNPARWTLSKITDPLGGTIEIDYERDEYSSIAGNELLESSNKTSFYPDSNPGFWEAQDNKIYLESSGFSVDDQVKIKFTSEIYSNDLLMCNEEPFYYADEIETTIVDVGSDFIEVDNVNGNQWFDVPILTNCSPQYLDGGTYGSVEIVEPGLLSKKGGDYRVASIEVTDESNHSIKTRYIYTDDGTTTGNSSGVVSREPDYVNSTDYPVYKYYDWPSTSVIYGKVSVLKGNLEDDSDFHTKQEFEFVTPNSNMITHNTSGPPIHEHDTDIFVSLLLNQIEINTNQIGQLKSVKLYDGLGNVESQTDLIYTNDLSNNQGVYAEGTLLFERLIGKNSDDVLTMLYRNNRTFKRYIPSVLSKVTTTKDGLVSETENRSWDLITGLVTSKTSKDPMGLKYESVTIPAYHKYPGMGPVTENSSNAHMLSQTAGTYVFKLNSDDTRASLLGASVQAWENNWDNYRELNSGAYADSDLENHQVWRIKDSYSWKGDIARLNSDGTYDINHFTEFAFDSSANPGWEKGSTINRFSHYSVPLETEDISRNKEYAEIRR